MVLANRGAEVAGGVDQPDVAECLRGVPELAMGHGVVLLAEQAEILRTATNRSNSACQVDNSHGAFRSLPFGLSTSEFPQ